jgi:hypothetical protein
MASKADNGSVAKKTKTSGTRQRRPKTAQSVVTQVSPGAIERFADAIARWFCAVGQPDDGQPRTGDEKPSRDQLGSSYIAAIAEQRPGVDGHGYPGGEPDWDDTRRLYLDRLDPFSARSLIMPDWMGLPLVLRLMADPELRAKLESQQDEAD